MGLLGTRAPLVYFSCSFQQTFCLNNTLPTLGLSSLLLGNPGSTTGDDEIVPCWILITTRKSLCKVMFLYVSVILFTGRGVCLFPGWSASGPGRCIPPGHTHPRAPPPGQKTPRTPYWTHTHPRHTLWTHTPLVTHSPEHTHLRTNIPLDTRSRIYTPHRNGHWSGQYASYWNTFLLYLWSGKIFCKLCYCAAI